MAILDKSSIIDVANPTLHEDVVWVVGQESTGSLCLQPGGSAGSRRLSRTQRNLPASATVSSRDRVCRGSVVRQRHSTSRYQPANGPPRGVSGGKYSSPHRRSAMLVQTQYSQSGQRVPACTPDLPELSNRLSTSYERLPPLDQLRTSIKQLDSITPRSTECKQVISPLERMHLQDEEPAQDRPVVEYTSETITHQNQHSQPQHVK